MTSTPRGAVPTTQDGEPAEITDEAFASSRRVTSEDQSDYFGRTVFFYPDVADETVVYAGSIIGLDPAGSGAVDLFVPALLTVTGDTPEDNDEGIRTRINLADGVAAGTPGYAYQNAPLGPSVP